MDVSLPKGNRIIISKPNKFKNNPHHCPDDATVHAEEAAIKAARSRGIDLKGTTIYIARVGAIGDLRMSKPCPKCEAMIRDVGIRTVIYTNESGSITCERVNQHSMV